MNPRDLELLTVRDVAGLLKLHVGTIWRESARAEVGLSSFPRPLRLGPKTVRWKAVDIGAYLDKLAGGAK